MERDDRRPERVLVIGHSHVVAVLDALRSLGVAPVAEPVSSVDQVFFDAELRVHDFDFGRARVRLILLGGAVPPPLGPPDANGRDPRERYERAAAAAAEALGHVDLVVSACYGGEHSVFSLVEHPVPFDFEAGEGFVPGVRQIVPAEIIRRELGDRLRRAFEMAGVLRSLFPTQRVVQVAPPPPVEDGEFIRSEPEVFGQIVQDFGVAPSRLRRKIHGEVMDLLEDGLRTHDIELLPPPPKAVANGYLRQEFARRATHTNAAYGRLVLEQVGVR